jgi:glycosyltransferase involved in cell wall biosynthesis
MQIKKVCIAFLGNSLHDSRIVNLTNSLKEENCAVSVISFDWFISDQEYFDDTYKVFKLHKGYYSLFFYLRFAFILIKELIKTKSDIYFAEDLYTLPFVTTIAKIRNAKVYYNSRELYAFLGGLRNRPILQKLVKSIEQFFIKKVDLVLTTGEMDSDFLKNFYKINNTVEIRNIPLMQMPAKSVNYREMFDIPSNSLIMIYQGVLLDGRGIPIILRVMKELPELYLIIIGDGEQKNNFIKLIGELGISYRVFFIGTVKQKELINFTAGGDIGLSLIEDISLSYYHALPNKLFEYIMAGIPVLASNLPQMKKIVDDYNVGESVDLGIYAELINILSQWIANPKLLHQYKKNCLLAAQELNWKSEFLKVRDTLLN